MAIEGCVHSKSKKERYMSGRAWIVSIFVVGVFAILTTLHLIQRFDYAASLMEINELKITCKILEKCIDERENTLAQYEAIESKEAISEYIRKVNPKIFNLISDLLATKFIECSSDFEIPVGVIVALAQVESTFKYDAISDKGAVGIMQVEPKTWIDTLVNENIITYKQDLFDPSKNIIAGTYILKHYYDQCEESNKMEYAITRYLGGTKNGHFAKVMKSCGEYYLFIKERK